MYWWNLMRCTPSLRQPVRQPMCIHFFISVHTSFLFCPNPAIWPSVSSFMCWQERPFLCNPLKMRLPPTAANCTYLRISFNNPQNMLYGGVYGSPISSELAKEEYRKAIELDLKISRETIARPDVQVCGSIGQLRGVVLRHHNCKLLAPCSRTYLLSILWHPRHLEWTLPSQSHKGRFSDLRFPTLKFVAYSIRRRITYQNLSNTLMLCICLSKEWCRMMQLP